MKFLHKLFALLTLLLIISCAIACSSTSTNINQPHSVTFVADGEIINIVKYSDNDSKINQPQVPIKKGYLGSWESYILEGGHITVNAVYELITYKIDFSVTSISVENILTKDYMGDWDEIWCKNSPELSTITAIRTFTIESNDISISSFSIEVRFSPLFSVEIDCFYTDENCTQKFSGLIPKGTVGDIMLYAKKLTDNIGPL